MQGQPGINQIGLRTIAVAENIIQDAAIGSQKTNNGHSRWLMFGLTWVVDDVFRP